jgi:DNA-binding transcriptional ArsR family regulator
MDNNESKDNLSKIFHALGDPTRREILRMIAKGSPPKYPGFPKIATVLDLAKPFKMSLPAVSKHLKVLEKAGLIQRKKIGRFNHFELVDRPILDAKKWIESYTLFWNMQLDQLGDYLKSKGRRRKDKK